MFIVVIVVMIIIMGVSEINDVLETTHFSVDVFLII